MKSRTVAPTPILNKIQVHRLELLPMLDRSEWLDEHYLILVEASEAHANAVNALLPELQHLATHTKMAFIM